MTKSLFGLFAISLLLSTCSAVAPVFAATGDLPGHSGSWSELAALVGVMVLFILFLEVKVRRLIEEDGK